MAIPKSPDKPHNNTASHYDRDTRLFEYALRWRVSGWRAGAHKGSEEGRMGEFRRLVPFERAPDSRLDLRSSLRDPFGKLHVRQVAQRTSADIHALLDTSGSMAFGDGWRLHRAITIAQLFAQAAQAIHDRFGLAAGARSLALYEPARHHGTQVQFEHLSTISVGGIQQAGLLQAAHLLGRRRKLVVLLSDFEFPEPQLDKLLSTLSGHDIVPIRLCEKVHDNLPRYGLLTVRDLETGHRRLLWLRPSLRARWREQEDERQQALARQFSRHGCRALDIPGKPDMLALTRHLRET
ncbi:MAG: hypothetical protein ACK5ME_04805 [Parahaliea sp.]